MRQQCVQTDTLHSPSWKAFSGHHCQVAGCVRLGLFVLLSTVGWGVVSVSALAIDYFALGDSIASGYGLDDDGTACRRSMLAYPWQVVTQLQENFATEQFALLACSGATTGTLESQVTETLSRLTERPTLITLSIGANDFGWSDLRPFAQNLCTPDVDAFETWVASVAHSLEEHLVVQLERLLAYPQVEVILTDYYNPTNLSGAFWELIYPRCVLVNVYERSEYVVHSLNAAIVQTWQRLGSPPYVQVSSVQAAFRGHEAPRPWCGSSPPDVEETWLQFPSDPYSNATSVGGDCFHPNRMGAERYSEAVTALIPSDLDLPLRLQVNDSSLTPGESLTLTLTVIPEAIPSVVDLYVVLQWPDQSVRFLQLDGSLIPEPQPLVSTWTTVPSRAELFRYTFAGPELPGNYRWLAAFTEPGMGTIVGTVAQAPFTFTP
jgi:lysophospholipase L1-like esterase